MKKNTSISIIQLIKNGDISIDLEIENLNSSKDINVYIRQYLESSSGYLEIQEKISQARKQLDKVPTDQKEFLTKKLENLILIEKDFTTNALLLGKLFSEIEVPTDRLQQAMRLFDKGKIKEADAVLKASDLLNDQFNLLVNIDFLEARKNLYGNE